ncbi:YcaO-like family protein [Sphingosinicella sp. LHD-64]|uniref:YcaO-like family protein n=1 Tax=Sphingosinicella sp. LHD-64 TaxID=3072139 RepID=UPI00280CFD4D|nr:YcaO-like family protein [Sphingosinicella sp. LHD-64]MDQ8755486.1 YcaO-like family protein [Sphingosinicella sp. LHD-64]
MPIQNHRSSADSDTRHSDFGPAAFADSAFFEHVLAASEKCGVTRLADITGLDRLSLPVWQAVRPAGRALSVHQGKGASPIAAKIGALCEAIESHCAENAQADGPVSRFDELPASQTAAEIGDFCSSRDVVLPDEAAIQWCRTTDAITGNALYIPQAVVSLDYTKGLPSPFDRSSSGLGAGPTHSAALQTSVLELIERDAVGAWQRSATAMPVCDAIDLSTVPFDWFQAWRDRFRSFNVALDCYPVPSFTSVPVFCCAIGAQEEFGPQYRRFHGTSAHPDAEVALFKALAEAIQSRLTLIAGVRDDILPSYYSAREEKPAGAGRRIRLQPWREFTVSHSSWEAIVEELAMHGYRQIAVKMLSEGLEGIVVTKAFVPGLGSLTRSRRAA